MHELTERNGKQRKETGSYGKQPLLSQDELENAQKSADLAGPKNKHPFQEFGLGRGDFLSNLGQPSLKVGLGGQRFFQATIVGFNSLFNRLGDFCRLLFVENGAKDFKNLESIGVGHSYSLTGGVMKVKGTERNGEKQKETESYGKQPLLPVASFAFRGFPLPPLLSISFRRFFCFPMLSAASIAFCSFWPASVWAKRGLSTKFAEVEVKGLKIGRTYSLKDLVNFPLRITNSGDVATDIKVSVWPPGNGEGKQGYEPIPNINWIHLSQSTFTIYPGMDGVTDVIISIPNDPKLLGRRFIAYLWSESQNKGFLGVGLKSRILISISSQKPTEEELKKKFVEKRVANLNFSFAPMEILANNVPVGKKVKLKNFHADLKLSNPNDLSYHFRVSPVGIWETSIDAPGGFRPAPDPKWLIVPKEVFKAAGYTFTSLNLELKIPDKPEYRGKGFLLLLRAEILEQDIPAYAYAKVLVRTKK